MTSACTDRTTRRRLATVAALLVVAATQCRAQDANKDPIRLETKSGPTGDPHLLRLVAGGVTVESNLDVGGVLWSWADRGEQYVNVRDFGREIQSSYTAQNDHFADPHGGYRTINPTEGGSHFSDLRLPASRRQASPLIRAVNDGNTQRTRSAAIEWNPSLFGGDEDHAVLFTGALLGKNITLDYAGRGALAQYQTVLRPAYTSKTTAIEVPTAYLNGDFVRFYTYDASRADGSRVDEVHPPLGTKPPYRVQFTPASGFGGVIVSTADQAHAMGVYGVTVAHGGSVDYFTLWNFTHLGGTTPTSGGTSKFSAAYGPDGAFGRRGDATLEAGREYVFTTWLMTGPLAEVEAQMDWLNAQGVRGRITSESATTEPTR